MFEVMGRTVSTRIGKLPGSKHPGGEMLTEQQASAIVDAVKCLDPACKAPVQLVRGTSVRRAHFRHRPDTTTKCSVDSPMSEWHSYVQGDLFEGAFAHEHSIPGARIDAVVQRVNSSKLVAIEAQYSPIAPAIVLQRHERHRAAGIAGTVWIVPASHLDSESRVRTRWVADLVDAALDTPASAPGEPGYGCVVGFLDLAGQEDLDQEPAIHFIDTISKETRGGKPVIRVIKWVSPISLPAVRLWAQGKNRPKQILDEDLAAEIRRMDAVPTRRVKHTPLDKHWRKQGWS